MYLYSPCMTAWHAQGKIYHLPNTVTLLTILSQEALGYSVLRFFTKQRQSVRNMRTDAKSIAMKIYFIT
jgi:hypothetical protein